MKQLCCAFLFIFMLCSGYLARAQDNQGSGTADAAKAPSSGDKTAKADTSKPAAGDATEKASPDTSKTPFDEGSYTQATALAYRSMQETAAIIAKSAPEFSEKANPADKNTFVIFDPAAFSAINEYRVVEPQISLLKKGLYDAMVATQPASAPRLPVSPEWNALPGPLDVFSSSADVIEKILKLMQTETAVKGAGVNITDAALIAEVASQLQELSPKADDPSGNDPKLKRRQTRIEAIYYPGQYLFPKVDQSKVKGLFTSSSKDLSQPQGSLTVDVIALGLLRQQAQAAYNNLDKRLTGWDASEKENATLDAKPEPAKADEQDKLKKQKQANADQRAAILSALPGPDVDAANKEAVAKKVNAAKMIAASLKSYLDSSDAVIKGLGTPDSKGQTWLARLATAETLDDQVKKKSTQVLLVRWLRAGALNKTRKNLFFLGTRTYYGAGATALYEYYDCDQHLEKSGTVTATARYVHDTTFEKGRFNGTVRCLTSDPKLEENYRCPQPR